MRGCVDGNQAEIITALKSIFASVQDLHNVWKGCPDILVGYRGKNFLLEIKRDEKAKLTPAQEKWHSIWMGQAAVVTSAEEAIQVVTSGKYPMKNEQLVLGGDKDDDKYNDKEEEKLFEQYLKAAKKTNDPEKKPKPRFWYSRRGVFKR